MLIRTLACIALFTIAVLGMLAGCSSNTTAEVTGSITVDGQPAEKGSISFIPADGKSTTEGGIIENGKYTAKSAVGAMKVQIRVPKVTGKKQLYDDKKAEFVPTYSETLPKKYNTDTELTLDVKPGKNEKNWELTTK
ncbi:MAG TPA: hypothetical protein VG097_04825 [Gemmata sp.]|jgi:hypothetical protein|nr:hypothetical protein [Gemmata sp.]